MSSPLNSIVSGAAEKATANALASSGAGNIAGSIMANTPYGAIAAAIPALTNAANDTAPMSAATQASFQNGPVSINFGSGGISAEQKASTSATPNQNGEIPVSSKASSALGGINPMYYVAGILALIILKRKGML